MTRYVKAFEIMDQILARARESGLAVFLDYDGTLTPIVPRPEDAVMSEGMRETVRGLAARCTLGVVSGRELSDVENMVGLKEIVYAGDHGFSIDAPGEEKTSYGPAGKFLPAIKKAAEDLSASLEKIPGAWLEKKTYTLSAHYRQTPDERVPEIEKLVRDKARGLGLRLTSGKKVFELRPDVDWHKGKAVEFLREKLGVTDAFTIYIGDDTTDEDAFKALEGEGLGILVAGNPTSTAARALLDSPDEVGRFLGELSRKLPPPEV